MWRKSYGINDFKSSHFPNEIFKTDIFQIGYSSNGNIICLLNMNKYYKVKNWSDIITKAVVWCFDNVQSKLEDDAKMIGLLDMSGCGYRNIDFDLISKLCPIILNQFPNVVSNVFVIDVPWIAAPLLNGIKAFLPRSSADLLMSVSRRGIRKYLMEDDLPTKFGGNVEMEIIEVPDDMSTIEEVGRRLNLPNDSIVKFQAMINRAMPCHINQEE